MLAYLPSPASGAIHLGPLQLRAYGLCIALGVWAAVTVAARRYSRRGGEPALITTIAIWAVPGGILGARAYHVITDYELYLPPRGVPLNALEIWDGGLGIWGGVAAGLAVGAWVARRNRANVAVLFDCVAPAIPLAQAIGRWGNWFNQELFGRPTTLPWALKIDAAHRPAAFANAHTFQPIFLYESLWDLTVVGIVLLVERKFRLRTGSLLAIYIAAYTFGRFFTEYERIDFAHRFGPLRLNDWTSVVVFMGALLALIAVNRPGAAEHPPAGSPASDDHTAKVSSGVAVATDAQGISSPAPSGIESGPVVNDAPPV